MSEDIKDQVIKQFEVSGPVAPQLDEFTDASSCAQLTAFVRYIHNGVLKDEFLCCIDLPSRTHGECVCQIIDTFSGQAISNGNCCADFVQMVLRSC